MLSYMLPAEDKPPLPPGKPPLAAHHHPHPPHLRLALASDAIANGRSASTPISKETSCSSFASDATVATPSSTVSDGNKGGKGKVVVNGKHPTLKRVSFGSSKGSMVETLIFESPVQEETVPSPIAENPFPLDHDQTEAEREKVRVTFFQQSKPLEVDLPDEPLFSETDFMMASPITMNETNHVIYNRTESVESGWDNPFQPGGDLSREADEIVELIKGGKPITPTPGQQPPSLPVANDGRPLSNSFQEPITETPKKTATTTTAALKSSAAPPSNGTAKTDGAPVPPSPAPGAVDVQRGTVKAEAGDASQIEHVTIKKKPKCKCCVIQ